MTDEKRPTPTEDKGRTENKGRIPGGNEKGITFERCSRHGITYPTGSSCSACAAGK